MLYESFHESKRDIKRDKMQESGKKERESSQVICSLKSIVPGIMLHMRAKIPV